MTDYADYSGQTIGDYHLLQLLGSGAFGTVYLAEQIHNQQQVAIKLLHIHITQQEELRSFLNEARTIRLQHPNIMPLLDFGLGRDNTPFLVMAYATKGTVRTSYPRGTRVPLDIAIQYAIQIGAALQYAHDQGIIHRDVKPENMLVRSNGELLLSDFGIATTASSQSFNDTMKVGGTIAYMPSEQLDGNPCFASDQYALAIVLYEWLSGSYPFHGTALEIAIQHTRRQPPSLIEQVPGLPVEIEAALFKALAKDPHDRFPSVQDFMLALQQEQAIDHATQAMIDTTALIQRAARDATSMPTNMLPSGALPRLEKTIAPSKREQHVQMLTTEANMVTVPDQPHKRPKRLLLYTGIVALILLGMSIGAFAVLFGYLPDHSKGLLNIAGTPVATRQVTPTAQPIVSAYDNASKKQGIMFGMDPQHTHVNPYETTLNGSNVAQLQQTWAQATGDTINTVPSIVNGILYAASADGKLYAFNATTGKRLWHVEVGSNTYPYSSPAVAHGLVYIGSGDDKLYAFDAATGQQKWSAQTGNGVGGSPVIANNAVYVGANDGNIYAFNALNGQSLWTATAGGSIDTAPTIDNNQLYASSTNGDIYAFNATTGTALWTATTGDSLSTATAVAGGIVYAGGQSGKLYAFDTTSGQQKWSFLTGGFIDSSPAVFNGMIYFGSSDHNLYALNAATGRKEWVEPTGNTIYSSPIIANGLVYITAYSDNLYVFNATSGQQLWTTNNTYTITASTSPMVANGFVYIGSLDHMIYAFSLP